MTAIKILKQELTRNDLDALRQANEIVRGTPNYNKFYMEWSFKARKGKNGWKAWKFLRWSIPYSLDEAFVKKVGSIVYIMSKKPDIYCKGCMYRWEVTEDVNELLKIYVKED